MELRTDIAAALDAERTRELSRHVLAQCQRRD